MKVSAALLIFALTLTGCGGDQQSNNSLQTPTSDMGTIGEQYLGACPGSVSWDQAYSFVGEQVSVEGPVISAVYASESRGKPTFLNVGKDYPDPGRFVVVIWGYDRDSFPFPPEDTYYSKRICVTGVVEMYNGIPEIIVDSTSDIVTVN